MTYECSDALRDIDSFFSAVDESAAGDAAQDRALAHMVSHDTGERTVVCESCWDYYMEQKRLHCGG